MNPTKTLTTIAGTAVSAVQGAIRTGGNVITRLQHRDPAPKDLDDVTIARKVESIVFRPEGAPKDKVDVNVVDGIVHLHGEVKNPAAKAAIESAVRAIPEVKGVESMLKLPKTRQAKKPRARTTPRTTQRFTRERKSAAAEPSPTELAGKREGRKAAPLGSKDPSDGVSS